MARTKFKYDRFSREMAAEYLMGLSGFVTTDADVAAVVADCAMVVDKVRTKYKYDKSRLRRIEAAITLLETTTGVLYRTKLGTMPFANLRSPRPLVVGEKVWVPETTSFSVVAPRFSQPCLGSGRWWASCIVDKIDGDVVFLTRF